MTTAALTIEDAYKVIAYLLLPESWKQAIIEKVCQVRSPELVAQVRACLATLDKIEASKLKALDDPNFGLVQADVLKWDQSAKDANLSTLETQTKLRLRQLLDISSNFGLQFKQSYSYTLPNQVVL